MSKSHNLQEAKSVEALIQDIRQLSEIAEKDPIPGIFNCSVSLMIPVSDELRFSFTVSWLYQVYREHGGEGLKYCNRKLHASDPVGVSHYQLVDDFRTLNQHAIDPNSKRGREREGRCRAWFSSVCTINSQSLPKTEKDWDLSISAILEEAIVYLSLIKEFLESLNADRTGFLMKEFQLVRRRAIDHGDFDRMVAEVAADLGFSTLDAVKFRKIHYQSIIKDLSSQRWDTDIPQFVRGAITSKMISDYPRAAISVDELKALGVKPGQNLGKALAVAQEVYRRSEYAMSKDEIISELRKRAIVPA